MGNSKGFPGTAKTCCNAKDVDIKHVGRTWQHGKILKEVRHCNEPGKFLIEGKQVLPPYRLLRRSDGRRSKMRPRKDHDLIFYHNDFSANNVIVDPDSLKIKAVIGWEYSGFFPSQFERKFCTPAGPSVTLPGEVDDVELSLGIMET
jgi:hypothetical protein